MSDLFWKWETLKNSIHVFEVQTQQSLVKDSHFFKTLLFCPQKMVPPLKTYFNMYLNQRWGLSSQDLIQQDLIWLFVLKYRSCVFVRVSLFKCEQWPAEAAQVQLNYSDLIRLN